MSLNTSSLSRRIGLLLPSANTVFEPDFYRFIPDGWGVHTARMYLPDTTVEGEERMLDEYVLPAARDVATTRPHVVVFGCTSAGALRGNEYEAQLTQQIAATTGTTVVSVMKSVREALQDLQATRLVVITPYVEPVDVRIRASLEADGFEVLRIKGLGIQESFQLGQVPGEAIIHLARQAVEGLKPDALFVSCTNFPAVRVLPDLRKLFPFPVIASNQVTIEKAIAVAKENLNVLSPMNEVS